MPDISGWFGRNKLQGLEGKSKTSAQQAAGALHQAEMAPTPQAFQAAIQAVYQAARDAVELVMATYDAAERERTQEQTLPLAPFVSQVGQAFQAARASMDQVVQAAHAAQGALASPAGEGGVQPHLYQEASALVALQGAQGQATAALGQIVQVRAKAEEERRASQAKAEEERRRSQALVKEREQYLAQFGGVDPEEIIAAVKAGRHLSVPAAGLVLHKGEIALYTAAVTLAEDKTTRQYVGGSSGLSVPVGHGFRFRVGSYQGHTVSTEHLTAIDQGELVVTTQRIVYTGAKHHVVIPTNKVLSTVLYKDAVDVRAENRAKREVFKCSNPRLLNTYVQVACQLA